MRYALVLTGLLSAATTWGSPTGTIMGFAKDPSGAFVPGVKVTVSHAATNQALKATTESGGAYHFPQLAPGTYSLRAEAAGFKSLTIGNILVEVDQITLPIFSWNWEMWLKRWRYRALRRCWNRTRARSATLSAAVRSVVCR